eukprot:scaffold93960_cov29-Prasinocladus_malaysianus.AAC.2
MLSSCCRSTRADLRAAELVLAGVDGAAEELVEGSVAGEDHGAIVHLDEALAQAADVGADAHRAAGDVAEGEGLLVGLAGLAGNQTAAHQVLNTDA